MYCFSAAECREKLKRLRDNYRRAKPLRQTKSEQAATKGKPIRYEKELEFLSKYISNDEETLTNLSSSIISEDESEQTSRPSTPSTVQTDETSSNCPRVKKKRGAHDSDAGTPTSAHSLFQSYLEKEYSENGTKETDTVVEFFANLGKTVKTFPENIQVRIKGAVFKIINDAEMKVLNRKSNSTSQPATYKRNEAIETYYPVLNSEGVGNSSYVHYGEDREIT